MDERLKVFYELYERRKSVREYQDKAIPPEVVTRLVTTLNRAQSAANRQPWHFIVVEKKDRGELNGVFTKESFKNAPVMIVACAEPSVAWVRKTDGRNYAWVDVAIAVTEMLGAATAEGLGACWIASFDHVKAKKILGVPDDIEMVAVIAIGWPLAELKREGKQRKPLEEIIHYGRW